MVEDPTACTATREETKVSSEQAKLTVDELETSEESQPVVGQDATRQSFEHPCNSSVFSSGGTRVAKSRKSAKTWRSSRSKTSQRRGTSTTHVVAYGTNSPSESVRSRFHYESIWWRNYALLFDYCSKFGDVNVPKLYTHTLEDGTVVELGKWLYRQRSNAKHMNPDMYSALSQLFESCLLDWDEIQKGAVRVTSRAQNDDNVQKKIDVVDLNHEEIMNDYKSFDTEVTVETTSYENYSVVRSSNFADSDLFSADDKLRVSNRNRKSVRPLTYEVTRKETKASRSPQTGSAKSFKSSASVIERTSSTGEVKIGNNQSKKEILRKMLRDHLNSSNDKGNASDIDFDRKSRSSFVGNLTEFEGQSFNYAPVTNENDSDNETGSNTSRAPNKRSDSDSDWDAFRNSYHNMQDKNTSSNSIHRAPKKAAKLTFDEVFQESPQRKCSSVSVDNPFGLDKQSVRKVQPGTGSAGKSRTILTGTVPLTQSGGLGSSVLSGGFSQFCKSTKMNCPTLVSCEPKVSESGPGRCDSSSDGASSIDSDSHEDITKRYLDELEATERSVISINNLSEFKAVRIEGLENLRGVESGDSTDTTASILSINNQKKRSNTDAKLESQADIVMRTENQLHAIAFGHYDGRNLQLGMGLVLFKESGLSLNKCSVSSNTTNDSDTNAYWHILCLRARNSELENCEYYVAGHIYASIKEEWVVAKNFKMLPCNASTVQALRAIKGN